VALAYLYNQVARDPKGFADEDMTKWAGKLTEGQYTSLLTLQTQARTSSGHFAEKQQSVQQIMNGSQALLRSAGLDPSLVKDPRLKTTVSGRVAALQSRMLQWADGFETQNKRLPNYKELRDQMDAFLLEGTETTDPGAWFGGTRKVLAFEHVPGRRFEYDIPPKVRRDITDTLRASLHREPTFNEISLAYRRLHAQGLADAG
jgi:hypothetical protein